MRVGVLQEVGENPLEAQLVQSHQCRHLLVDVYVDLPEAISLRNSRKQFAWVYFFTVQFGGTGVDAGQFEQVHHHAVETPNLADHHVERLLRTRRQVGALAVQYLDCGGECGDGGTQLVADVAGESGLAFQTCLHCVGHLVERAGQAIEIGVCFWRHTSIKTARCDLAGSGGDARERPEHSSACQPACEAREENGESGAQQQSRRDGLEAALGCLHRKGLEVLSVGGRHADTNGHIWLALVLEALSAVAPLSYRRSQF